MQDGGFLVGDLMIPTNEQETIELFQALEDILGWHIVHLQNRCPDAIIENDNGSQLTIEFEYAAKNFKLHQHPSNGCDAVVCWHNNWPDATLPVWSLEETLFLIKPTASKLLELAKQKTDFSILISHLIIHLGILGRELEKSKQEVQVLSDELRVIKEKNYGTISPVTSFNINRVGLIYTDSDRDSQRIHDFLDMIFWIPEVRAIQDNVNFFITNSLSRPTQDSEPDDLAAALDKLGR